MGNCQKLSVLLNIDRKADISLLTDANKQQGLELAERKESTRANMNIDLQYLLRSFNLIPYQLGKASTYRVFLWVIPVIHFVILS